MDTDDAATALLLKAMRDEYKAMRSGQEKVTENINALKIELMNYSSELAATTGDLEELKQIPARVEMISYRLHVMEKGHADNVNSARSIAVNLISTLIPWLIVAAFIGYQFINKPNEPRGSHETHNPSK